MAGDGAAAPDRPVSLAVSGLGCLRGGKVLFRDLGFVLERGQALVVNGANGAGKSSLLRSLAGLLPWRAGQLQWCGQTLKPTDAAYAQRLAYLGHHSGMSDTLTGLENLRFALTLAEVPWDTGLVQQVLQSPELTASWTADLARMRERIKDMRSQLHAALAEHFGERRDFGFLLTQRGMFSYTGISAQEVDRLRDEHGVYLVRTGRMCMSGLSQANVQYVAQAMAKVLGAAQ